MPFPTTAQTLTVEFYIDGVWTDLTDLRPTYNFYVLGLNGVDAILIARELRSEQDVIVNNLRLQLTYFDPGALMDGDNPLSPYYRKIGFGTRMRVKIAGVVSVMIGITSIVPVWGERDEIITANVEGRGAIGLLESQNPPAKSALRRAVPLVQPAPYDYWPMEEGTLANDIVSSALPGGKPLLVVGNVNFGTIDGPVGSNKLPGSLLDDQGSLSAISAMPAGVTSWQFAFIMKIPIPTATTLGGLLFDFITPAASTNLYDWQVAYIPDADGVNLTVLNRSLDPFAPTVQLSWFTPDPQDNQWHLYNIVATQNGGDVTLSNYLDGALIGTATATTATLNSISKISISPVGNPTADPLIANVGLGHLMTFPGTTVVTPNLYQAMLGYAGEDANTRIERVAHEEGITYKQVVPDIVTDIYNRTVASGLGTADLGGGYSLIGAGGTILASDWNVTPGIATTLVDSVNSYRASYVAGVFATNVEAQIKWQSPLALGDMLEPGNIAIRITSLTSFILFRTQVTPTATVEVAIYAATGSIIGALRTVPNLTHREGVSYISRVRAYGKVMSIKVWQADLPEPVEWTLIVTDSAAAIPGYTGWRNGRPGGNTNLSPVMSILQYNVVNLTVATELVGPQQIASPLTIMIDAARVDGGILFDAKDDLTLHYLPRVLLQDQYPALALTYASSHLSPPFSPATDDGQLANDITANRIAGSTATYKIPDDDFFHWSTQVAPTGAGDRAKSITLNVAADTQLNDQAGWHAHLLAWREKRIANITVQLERAPLVASATLTAAVKALELGGVITVGTVGAPPWMPPDEIRLITHGYTQTAAQFSNRYVFNTRPYDPYEVDVVDTSGSNLAAAITTTGTTLKVATSLGPEWSEADPPYYIQIGGEVMRVTAVTTDTMTFIASGSAGSANNASIALAQPAGITADLGQLLLIWATIRNSGTGTVNDISGWTTLTGGGTNIKLFARYFSTGGGFAPTVTFTGGVLNADTQARMFAFSGVSKEFASGTKLVPAATRQLNGVLQNVDYPALTLVRTGTSMIYAWKQDDATGYAPPSGYTEMADNSATAGDDSSIAAYYDLTGLAAAAGSLVVTGGVAAISRGAIMAFRPLQTFTVVRSINNIVAAHSIGDAIRGWRMGVTGL